MSTEFSKITEQIEGLKTTIQSLAEDTSKSEAQVKKYEEAKEAIEALVFKIAKYKKRLNEKDPDKQTYGPTMKKRVENMVDKFDEIYQVFDEQISPIYEPLLISLLNKRREHETIKKDKEESEKLSYVRQLHQQTIENELQRNQKLMAQKKEELQRQELAEQQAREEAQKEEKRKKDLDEAINYFSSYISKIPNNNKQICIEGLQKMISLPFEDFRIALKNVLAFTEQVLSNPSQLSNRLIRLQNPQFAHDIGLKPGSLFIMRSLGFTIRRAKTLSSEFDELKVKPPNPETIYLYLEEPDRSFAMNAYEQWLSWLDNIQEIHSMLLLCSNKATEIAHTHIYVQQTEKMINYINTLTF